MEKGTINTAVIGNVLHLTWSIEKFGQCAISPPIVFDTYDKFKMMFLLKLKVMHSGYKRYFIKTKIMYGILPERFTMSIQCGPRILKDIIYLPEATWTSLGDTLWSKVAIVKSTFTLQLPNTDISMLYSSETNFSSLWTAPGADITIEAADGKKKNVHKTVLLARSEVFRAMWRNEMVESKSNHLKIPELDEDSLNAFISYLYHGRVADFNLSQWFTLLDIADKYNIKGLLAKCQNVLQKNLSKDNAIDIYILVDQHDLRSAEMRTMQFIKEHIADIILTKAWHEIDNVSFFKRLCADLLTIEEKEIVMGDISDSVEAPKHQIAVNFPVDATSHKIDCLMTVSPEFESASFRLRVEEIGTRSIKLSICQYHSDDNYYFTNVSVSNIKMHMLNKASLPSQVITLPEMVMNTWYDVAVFSNIMEQFAIKLEILYDILHLPSVSAFEELWMDTSCTDVSLESADGIVRPVHKSVLMARNLTGMVDQCDSNGHLKLSNLNAPELDEFIKFVYSAKAELHVDCCAALLSIAHVYNLPELKYECEIKLKTVISADSAVELLSLAVSNSADFLVEWTLHFLQSNNWNIIESNGWRECRTSGPIKKIIEYLVDTRK